MNSLSNVNMIGEDACIFDHEEADINIISFILVIHQKKKIIQVIADDNDIFALLCHFIWKLKLDNVSITMKKSDGSVIDIIASALQLGEECKDLLTVHVLTGYNYQLPIWKGKDFCTEHFKEVSSQPTLLWKSCFHSQKNCIKWAIISSVCCMDQLLTQHCELRYKVFSKGSSKKKPPTHKYSISALSPITSAAHTFKWNPRTSYWCYTDGSPRVAEHSGMWLYSI